MKNTLIGLATVVILASCSEIAGWSGKNTDSTNAGADSSMVYRDLSITEANAYSDLFLDSNAVENYIRNEKLADTTARMMRDFYAVRNYQYAWFASGGLTEQARGLWSLHPGDAETSDSASSGNKEDSLSKMMDTLLANDSLRITAPDSTYAQTELQLTQRLVQYAASHPGGWINRQTVYYLVPAKRMSTMEWADSILNRQKDSARYASHPVYTALKTELGKYYSIVKSGEWTVIPSVKNLKKGSAAPAVTAIKKRLRATGDYASNDTSAMFSDSLAAAIRAFEQRTGLEPDGMMDDSLLAELNVPAEKRMQQILVNMNRLLWMPPLPDSNRIQVNIPSFMLYAYEGSNRVFEMPVIVGKEGSSTVMFNDTISQIVFSPSWNLPQSIVRDEILPKMKKDPGYLKKNNMEIVSRDGDIPTIRQLPGADNAMGRVKFLFPNSFDIYLHDTPQKDLFARKDRAQSHGCIRVADAPKLAQYLLRDQQEWSNEKISAAMNAGREQKVELKNPQLVLITYLTAWTDEQGRLNFRKDVYGHDQEAMERMFADSTKGRL